MCNGASVLELLSIYEITDQPHKMEISMPDPKPVTAANLDKFRGIIADMPINTTHAMEIEDVVAACYDVIHEARYSKKQGFDAIANALNANGFKVSERRLKKEFEDLAEKRAQTAGAADTPTAAARAKPAKAATSAAKPVQAA